MSLGIRPGRAGHLVVGSGSVRRGTIRSRGVGRRFAGRLVRRGLIGWRLVWCWVVRFHSYAPLIATSG